MSRDKTLDAWATLAAREVVECDQCGFNQAVTSSLAAQVIGWTFTEIGTSCPICADTL